MNYRYTYVSYERKKTHFYNQFFLNLYQVEDIKDFKKHAKIYCKDKQEIRQVMKLRTKAKNIVSFINIHILFIKKLNFAFKKIIS